jgi:CxxC-x17-CxxC domain-containing protein
MEVRLDQPARVTHHTHRPALPDAITDIRPHPSELLSLAAKRVIGTPLDRPEQGVSFVSMDRTLTCSDCGSEFSFTASEQDFYTEKGFSEPRRCPSCRAARKAARDGGSSYGGSRSSYSSGPREMFTATCASCGREARVPFNPTSGKPVYCSDCFRSR